MVDSTKTKKGQKNKSVRSPSTDKVKTLGDAMVVYMSKVKEADKESVNTDIMQIVRWLGAKKSLSEVMPDEVGAFSDDQYSRTAPPSYDRMKNIRNFLAFLKKSGWVGIALSTHLRLSKSDRQTQKSKTVEKREIQLTSEGYRNLQDELRTLQTDRERLIGDMKRAAADGDFRENSPLDAAREDHGRTTQRIAQIENIFKSAVVIKADAKESVVRMGSKIELFDSSNKSTIKYQIVEVDEADPFRGKISVESPIGMAMINRAQGEKVQVVTPAGTRTYTLKLIS